MVCVYACACVCMCTLGTMNMELNILEKIVLGIWIFQNTSGHWLPHHGMKYSAVTHDVCWLYHFATLWFC